MDCRSLTTIATAALATVAFAGSPRPGRAHVEWLSKTVGYLPGEPVITALKMTLDEGWHTYWINPGEAGMPLSTEIELPAGWTMESPQYPFPIRFNTGDLADFGYEGTVWFPILLHPPQDGEGDVEIHGTFSWLACDDSACIPGDATLSLSLKHSGQAPAQAAAATEIAKAQLRIPTDTPDGWRLDVLDLGGELKLSLTLPASHDPRQLDVFPLTPSVIEPSAIFDWHGSDGKITANVSKSSFAPNPVETLDIVINAPSLDRPITVGWKSK